MLFYNRTIHELEKFSLKEKIDERKLLSLKKKKRTEDIYEQTRNHHSSR